MRLNQDTNWKMASLMFKSPSSGDKLLASDHENIDHEAGIEFSSPSSGDKFLAENKNQKYLRMRTRSRLLLAEISF